MTRVSSSAGTCRTASAATRTRGSSSRRRGCRSGRPVDLNRRNRPEQAERDTRLGDQGKRCLTCHTHTAVCLDAPLPCAACESRPVGVCRVYGVCGVAARVSRGAGLEGMGGLLLVESKLRLWRPTARDDASRVGHVHRRLNGRLRGAARARSSSWLVGRPCLFARELHHSLCSPHCRWS